MKKFNILFAAIIFSGVFAEADKAANDYAPGSGTTFSETETEGSKTLTFTDADGNTQTATVGDALKVVTNTDGTFKGYALVTVADQAAQGWSEVTETASA